MVVLIETQRMRDIAGDGAADLYGCALASGRAAGEVCEGRAYEREDRHACVNETLGKGAVDHEVVAAFGR